MSPLNKWKRRSLLFTLVILFLILGPWVLLNSFGYRLDDALGIVKTGGVYIHSNIPNASVYINGKYIKDNGALIRNVLVQKLKPNQNYKIDFYKDGYHSWTKELFVYPSLVSEGRVMMLPLELEQREIFPFFDEEGEGKYTPVPGFTKVSRTADGRIIPENSEYIDVVTLFEGENPFEQKPPEVIKSENILEEEKEELPEYYEELGIEDPEELENLIETSDEISWLQNGNIVLYWTDYIESIPYYYCSPNLKNSGEALDGIENKICNNEITLDWENRINRFAYYPGRNDVWIVSIWNGIYAVEVDSRSQRNIQPIYMGEGVDFRLDNSGNLIVKDKGAFIEVDL